MNKREFPNRLARTKKLLAWYDRQEVRRNKLADAVETNADVDKWLQLCERHAKAVKEAFYLDTKEINSHDRAMLIDIPTLREWCKRSG